MQLGRWIAYVWASPNTLIGLLAAATALMTGGRARVVDGVLEVHGGFATFALRRLTLFPAGAAAMTLGHVVLGQNEQSLVQTRRHERIHVRQCERWGPLFLPTYLGVSAVLWITHRDAYRDNFFERQAYADDPAA